MRTARPDLRESPADVELPPVPAPFRWCGRAGVVWLEAALPGGRAAFSTRLGGFSEGRYRSLNLGVLTDDEPACVARNRAALAAALGREPGGIAIGLQVHGAEVQCHSQRPRQSPYARRGTRLARVDAHATARPDVTPFVLVADCVPLVLSAGSAVAAVHCGWRGVVAGVVERAVDAVRDLDGGHAPAAALGPGIGVCCYEIGPDVRDAFRARGHANAVFDDGRLNLPLAVRRELERAGVEPAAIFGGTLCSSCHPKLFFSHRRDDGVTGRQAGLAWREP